eukprot:258372_1
MEELPPNPKLRDVTKICKSAKDVDFTRFFDSNQTNLYISVRHRYNQLIDITADGISHLKLFTKFLKNILDAQQASSESCLAIVENYREEEPTLNTAGFAKISDEVSVSSPSHHSDQKSGDNSDLLHRKTDFDAFSDIFAFERNMAQLLVMYWKRLNSEVYEPLYEYRKSAITKLEGIQELVFNKYDKFMKMANKLREQKVATLIHWNELCDARHALRKARSNAPDSNKTKKQASKVKTHELKAKKQFESVVESVDKFNNAQDEFWNEVVRDACVQLEAIEYSRICFYQEYFDKYQELLEWRRAELHNGERTLGRARKMMMTPFETAEYGIHPIRVDHGSYAPIPPQQYELPCMPEQLLGLTGKLAEQRIDPQMLTPVFNPFGDALKPSTSRHIKTNYSRTNSMMSLHNFHDRQQSASVSQSVSMCSIHQPPPAFIAATAFPDNNRTASALFSRTNKQQSHAGGLPRPFNDSDEDDTPHTPRSPPPPKPPRGVALRQTSTSVSPKNKPQLPPRPPPNMSSANNIPRRPKRSPNKPPRLPPRRQTSPVIRPVSVPRVPNKSAYHVAEVVRKTSIALVDQTSAQQRQKQRAKAKSTWKVGK